MVPVPPVNKLSDVGEVVTKHGVGEGIGDGEGGAKVTLTSVSVAPVDWQTRPSDNVAVAHTAAEPTFTPVTVVENGLLPSFVGLTVAIDVL